MNLPITFEGAEPARSCPFCSGGIRVALSTPGALAPDDGCCDTCGYCIPLRVWDHRPAARGVRVGGEGKRG